MVDKGNKIELREGSEVVGVIAMTFFFVLFPLAAIVYAGTAYMISITFPIWATVILGILMFVVAVIVWLAITGSILGKMGGKG